MEHSIVYPHPPPLPCHLCLVRRTIITYSVHIFHLERLLHSDVSPSIDVGTLYIRRRNQLLRENAKKEVLLFLLFLFIYCLFLLHVDYFLIPDDAVIQLGSQF